MERWRGELYRNRQFELYHHGILGQKWGKRNGPPYPLGSGDHSASEKKAGWRNSLDKAGGKSHTGDRKGKQTKEKHNKSGHLDDFNGIGKQAVQKILGEIGSRPASVFGGFKPPSMPDSPSPKPKRTPVIRDPKTGFKMIKETTQESLKNANPLRGTNQGGNNCTYCTVAGFLRTAGFDVTAKSTGGEMQNLGGVLEDCFKGVKVFDGSAIKFGKSPDDAAEMLKKRFGDNASGAVGIDWISRRGGHAFSWEIKDGVVNFLDFQQGTTGSSVLDYWSRIDRNGSLVIARLDGLEINLDAIDKYVDGR